MINDLIGKKFAYFGRGPDTYDCYGLALEIYSRLGRKLPDYESSDDASIQAASFLEGLEKYTDKVEVPEKYDLIMFQILPCYVSHIGVYLGRGKFIHVMHKVSVVIEELNNPIWQNKFRGFYRYRG